MPENQVHRADQHVMQAAADMASRLARTPPCPRHAGHLDQEPQNTNSGTDNRIKWLMPHHAADQHLSGVRVVSADSRNRKPKPTQWARRNTQKRRRRQEDDEVDVASASERLDQQNRPITTATVIAAPRPAAVAVANQPQQPNSAIRPVPTGSAAARHVLEICSAGVDKTLFEAYS